MSDQPMTVTDEDREAAAEYMEDYLLQPAEAHYVRDGSYDLHPLVQAFAAHRIAAAQAERDAVVKWLRSAINGSETVKYGNLFADEIEAGDHLTPPTA